MKKLLLVSTAIVGVVMISAPAFAANIKMDIGGYFRGYGAYDDADLNTGRATNVGNAAAVLAVDNLRTIDLRRDNGVTFSGESTLDNGLTVGAYTELKIAGTDAAATVTSTSSGGITTTSTAAGYPGVKYAYAYGSGGWGRVNFGSASGAAYLLQVAAPSADSNIDGMRVNIQTFNTDLFNDGLNQGARNLSYSKTLQYQNADFDQVDRITYLTPKFNGFQAGVSWAPRNNTNALGSNLAAMNNDANTVGAYNNLWEGSARWDANYQGVGIALGAGYANAGLEAKNTTLTAVGSDNRITYNFGANFAFQGFSLGGAYLHDNNAISSRGDTRTYVLGAGWDNGPYHVGFSWLNSRDEANVTGVNGGVDQIGGAVAVAGTNGVAATHLTENKYTGGAGYTFGPGMTFRGAVSYVTAKTNGTEGKDALNVTASSVGAVPENKQTQITIGTDIKF